MYFFSCYGVFDGGSVFLEPLVDFLDQDVLLNHVVVVARQYELLWILEVVDQIYRGVRIGISDAPDEVVRTVSGRVIGAVWKTVDYVSGRRNHLYEVCHVLVHPSVAGEAE